MSGGRNLVGKMEKSIGYRRGREHTQMMLLRGFTGKKRKYGKIRKGLESQESA